MQTPRAYWSTWANRLQRWNLDGFAAWLLESGGPFTLLSAQALYFSSPFIKSQQVEALAKMFEEESETLAFVDYLRRETSA